MHITIYSKDNCPNCDKAIAMSHAYTPEVLKIGEHISREKFFEICGNVKTVPQVFVDGVHIGGHLELEKHLSINTIFTKENYSDF